MAHSIQELEAIFTQLGARFITPISEINFNKYCIERSEIVLI